MDTNADIIDVDDSLTHRRFISVQRRYDNVRVRDSEITQRLCYDCGEVVIGGEREYQDHILIHEAVYLAYQLYHFEKNQQASSLEHTKKQSSSLSEKLTKEKDSKHKDVVEQPLSKVPKRDDTKDVVGAKENPGSKVPERKPKSEQEQQSVNGAKRDQKPKEENQKITRQEKSSRQMLADEQKPKVPVDSVPVDKGAWTSLYFIRGGGDGTVATSDKQTDDRSKKSSLKLGALSEAVEKSALQRPLNRLVDLQTPVNSVPVLPEEEVISGGVADPSVEKAGACKTEQSQQPTSSGIVSRIETTSLFNMNENRVEKQSTLAVVLPDSNTAIVAETLERILDAVQLQVIPDNTTTQLSSPPTLSFQSSPPTLSLATAASSTESIFCTVTTASTSNGQPGDLSSQQTPTNARLVGDDLSMESADISMGSF